MRPPDSKEPLPGAASWTAELRAGRVACGAGILAELGEVVRQLGGRRVLVVTDPGIEAAGHVARAIGSLEGADLEVFLFDGVEENPTEKHVALGVEAAKRSTIDFVVGLGGGSAMDCAKGINFLYTNGGKMEDYWGFGHAEKPMLASVGIPCTAGTGSEAQSYALISRENDHRKLACGDPKARFRAVLLDPELVRTVPAEVAAITGLDAISHALESFVCRARNPFSQTLAVAAWQRLDRNYLPAVGGSPVTVAVLEEMLVGAHLAGAAIETSMLGAAHACANPLTARFEVTHGVAVGLMLPHVIRFNGEEVDGWYRDLLGAGASPGSERASEVLAARVEELRAAAGLPASLRAVGVDESALDGLSAMAVDQWTAQFNPRKVEKADLQALYETAYGAPESLGPVTTAEPSSHDVRS